MRVGVLALQGDVREHAWALESLGVDVELVKRPQQLERVEAMVLPGGESTTLGMLLDSSQLRDPLNDWVHGDRPTFGTCAGLVMLADRVEDGREDQKRLGGLGITVRRNGYGRQLFSFEDRVAVPSLGDPMEAVFIRAPRIMFVDEGTSVLANLDTAQGPEPVAVQRGNLLGCSFHPELTSDTRLHQRLLDLVYSL